MFTDPLLAAGSAAPGGQLWRPLLIFGVIALLMALVVVAQMTDPRRRSGGEHDLDGEPPAPSSPATAQTPEPGPAADDPADGPDRR